ncbi:MAG: aldehyde dehydrogenase family protein, partial [Planctomycetota bacterium]
AAGASLAAGSIDDGDPATVMPHLLLDVSPDAELVRSDVFAPVLSVMPVADDRAALAADGNCPYALGATVFGREDAARELAACVDAGCVVINDFLIPTADPRVAFGGRGESGFGVTRGGEGLREMTRPKTVLVQKSSWRPHLDPPTPGHEDFFKNYLRWQHAENASDRRAGMFAFLREVYAQWRAKR